MLQCGYGPNVMRLPNGDLFYNVHKPISGGALLAEVGVVVPDGAEQAYLCKMRADLAMRSNKPKVSS